MHVSYVVINSVIHSVFLSHVRSIIWWMISVKYIMLSSVDSTNYLLSSVDMCSVLSSSEAKTLTSSEDRGCWNCNIMSIWPLTTFSNFTRDELLYIIIKVASEGKYNRVLGSQIGRNTVIFLYLINSAWQHWSCWYRIDIADCWK